MPFYDEARDQLLAWLNSLDFSTVFPSTYSGTKGAVVMNGWPFDLIDNMLQETNGTMTVPIVSLVLANASDDFRSLGGLLGAGSVPGTALYGTRVTGTYLLSAWADSNMGGSYVVEGIGGIIMGQAFVARERLTKLRHLHVTSSHEPYLERPQVWCLELMLECDTIVSYYA